MTPHRTQGFTLVEVLVALMVVAIGLAALMVSVSGAARTSGYLRDKTLAQWIAMNRITEVRLNSSNKFAPNTDTSEVNFGGRTWHYDTRYFDTSITTMKRVVVRVYAGDAKAKGGPLIEATGFLGAAISPPGSSNSQWRDGASPPVPGASGALNNGAINNGAINNGNTTINNGNTGTQIAPTPNPVSR